MRWTMLLLHQGFSDTTLPSFQIQMSVPCIRAIWRAFLAERRKARPTIVANVVVLGSCLRDFMALPPEVGALPRSYRKPPRRRRGAGRQSGNSASRERSVE